MAEEAGGKVEVSGEAGSVTDLISDMLGEVSESGKEKEGEAEIKPAEEAELESNKESESESEPEVAEDKDEVIRQLREQLAADKVEIETESEPKVDDIKAPDVVADFFVSDEEYDKAFEDKKVMNEVLKRVHAKAVESTLRTMPQVIDNIVRKQVIIYSKATDFFKRNPDLKSYAKFVSVVTNDITSKDPKLTLDEIFGDEKDAGKLSVEVRRRLALKGEAIKKEEKKDRERPAFIKGGGARVKQEAAPVKTGIEKEIEDLIL